MTSRRKVTDKDDTNTDLERGLANLRPSTTTSTTQLSHPMEAIQVLIQTMEESRKIEYLAMEERHREAEERHREAEERRTREMEVKEESRRAEYKAIEEQHRRELHEMLQMQLKLQQEHQNEVWLRQKDLDDSRRDRDRKRKLADKIAPWTERTSQHPTSERLKIRSPQQGSAKMNGKAAWYLYRQELYPQLTRRLSRRRPR